MTMLCCCAGTSAQLSWQYGYSYDINNGIVPYSASTLQQQYQTPNFTGSALLSWQAGFKTVITAGLVGSASFVISSAQGKPWRRRF